MEILLFIFYLLTTLALPVGSIVVLVLLLKHLFKPSSSEKHTQTLLLLRQYQITHPKATLKQAIDMLESLDPNTINIPLQASSYAQVVTMPAPKPPADYTDTMPLNLQPSQSLSDQTSSLSSWYSENSINLLLYVGAFLMVVTVSLFVGFSWSSLSGALKALVVTIATLLFYGTGMWLYEKPTVRSAGSVFTGIGTILIPFAGIAWHTLVLSTMQVPFGISWTITSLIWILASLISLALTKNNVYTYVMSLGTVSIFLAAVQWAQLPDQFFVLAAEISAFVLVGLSVIAAHKWHTPREVSQALELSAHATLPIALFYGLSVALTRNILFTYPSAIAVLTAVLFYTTCYLLNRRYAYAVMAEILLPIGVGILFSAMHASAEYISICLTILGIVYTVVGHLRKHDDDVPEGLPQLTAAIGIGLASLVTLIYEAVHPTASWTTTGLSLLTAGAWISMAWSFSPLILLGAFPFVARLLYTIVFYDHMYAKPELVIALAYSAVAISLQFIAHHHKAQKEQHVAAHTGSAFFFVLAVAFASSHLLVLALVSTLIAGICLNGALHHDQPKFAYGTTVFATWSVWLVLQYTRVPYQLYVFIFAALYFALYTFAVTLQTKDAWKKVFRSSSYVGILLTSLADVTFSPVWLFTGTMGQNIYGTHLPNGIIVGALATVFFVLIGYNYKIAWQKYLASAIAMITFTRVLLYADYSDMLLYTTAWGLYFIGLGFTRRHKMDEPSAALLDIVGLVIWFFPLFGELYGTNPVRAAIIMALLGIGIMFYGITITRKYLTYSGVAALAIAVLSQTYKYIFGLEQWMITGVLAILFLGGAIWLLLGRAHKTQTVHQT